MRGDFFTTTGEVLLPKVDYVQSTDDEIKVMVSAEWTFPLRFAEVVWGRDDEVHQERFPLASTRPHGADDMGFQLDAPGWEWVRVAVWDVAGNGAFVNPTWRD